ncbi:hypothetical protein AC578_1936 [Pseudocercospora eumusae]|uniref:Uncharacterized protein n=1 Tax=Pseudocercospora eumusae TaxID=321146 RepID=A0A139HDF3_9PEZI|nr:hypothetical protein AC578_1936 [Pseudocercospora eumusae]KXT00446.1 hypothetical protein AC578_1936 [Pseudocercospora eumusae]
MLLPARIPLILCEDQLQPKNVVGRCTRYLLSHRNSHERGTLREKLMFSLDHARAQISQTTRDDH